MVKLVYYVDYPMGKKAEYLAWVKTIAPTLLAPDEVKRITSYDNTFSASPNRIMEMEFENMEALGHYCEREEIKSIIEGILDNAENVHSGIFTLRGDYSKE